LVRLNTDERNASEFAVASEASEKRRDVDACVSFVDDLDININVRTQYTPFCTIRCDAVNGG
jgi:hypothetical protein